MIDKKTRKLLCKPKFVYWLRRMEPRRHLLWTYCDKNVAEMYLHFKYVCLRMVSFRHIFHSAMCLIIRYNLMTNSENRTWILRILQSCDRLQNWKAPRIFRRFHTFFLRISSHDTNGGPNIWKPTHEVKQQSKTTIDAPFGWEKISFQLRFIFVKRKAIAPQLLLSIIASTHVPNDTKIMLREQKSSESTINGHIDSVGTKTATIVVWFRLSAS